MVVCLRFLLYHILSLIAYAFRGNREFVSISIVQLMMSANILIHFGLQIALVCLYSTPSHYHHCANLFEGIELIKWLSEKFCRVSKLKHILSVMHYTICGLYVFSLPFLRVRAWNDVSAVCLSIFLCNRMAYMKRMETLGSHVMQSTRSNINKCYKWKSYTHIL